MADINAYRKQAIDGTAPQHKVKGQQVFEISEGSDGTLHVKPTDTNGNPIDPREVNNADVVAKLTEMDAKIQATNDRLNQTLDTQVTGSNAEDTITYQRSGTLASGASETLVDIVGKECELQSLSLGSGYRGTQIRVSFYKKDGTLDGNLMIATSNGTALAHPSVTIVANESNGENDFWRVAKDDTTASRFVLVMKRPLKALNGLKITVHNFDSVNHDVAINSAIASWA